MGNKRYQKYSHPLTNVQRSELKNKEFRPDAEKRHLEIISYNDQKLVDIICNESSSIFDKSIAKEEILRRLNKETKSNAVHDNTKAKINKSKNKKWKKFKQTAKKTGRSIGDAHQIKYNEFISSGGDPNACPFDQ